MKRIGVVALQGDVSEHVSAMQGALGEEGCVVPVRKAGLIPDLDGIVIPGGESTTISRLMDRSGIGDEIKAALAEGKPVMATCAGLVLAGKEVFGGSSVGSSSVGSSSVGGSSVGSSKVHPLGLMDSVVDRNAFGTQRESFEADLQMKGFDRPYRAVFIRAPVIREVGPHVDVLARIDEGIVAAREGKVLCLSFHPELTNDPRFHMMFIDMIEEA